MKAIVCFKSQSPAREITGVSPARGMTALGQVVQAMGLDIRRENREVIVRERTDDNTWVTRCRIGMHMGVPVYHGDSTLGEQIVSEWHKRVQTVMAYDVSMWLRRWLNKNGAVMREGVWVVRDARDAEALAETVKLAAGGRVFVTRLPAGSDAVEAALEYLRERIEKGGSAAQMSVLGRECKKFAQVFDDYEHVAAAQELKLLCEGKV